MKLDFDSATSALTIGAYGPGWIQIRDQRITTPCVVSAQAVTTDLLPPHLAALEFAHFERLAEHGADIVILGTGSRQHFVDYTFVTRLAALGIGLEVMDTGAACRSYNVLVGEERAVLAALYML